LLVENNVGELLVVGPISEVQVIQNTVVIRGYDGKAIKVYPQIEGRLHYPYEPLDDTIEDTIQRPVDGGDEARGEQRSSEPVR
jgi:hypothetical protein